MVNFEEWLAFISTHLPDPVTEEQTEGGVTFKGGEPGQVIVRLTQSRIVVLEYAIAWTGPTTPVVAPRRIGTVVWRRAPTHATVRAVAALIEAARDARLAKFRMCAICERSIPPEWMDDERICQPCADREGALARRAGPRPGDTG